MSKFIESISCLTELHPFQQGFKVDFQSGINIIAGDQGTGKSTLLELIIQAHTSLKDKVLIKEASNFGYFYFNSELHNPRSMTDTFGMDRYDITLDKFIAKLGEDLSSSRLTNAQAFLTKIYSTYNKVKNEGRNLLRNKLSDLDVLAQSAVRSHGQALIPFLEEITNYPNAVILLDEPETALSIKSQYYLIDLLWQAVDNNCQIICCTHSEILMSSQDQLLCMDNELYHWVNSSQHIKEQHDR